MRFFWVLWTVSLLAGCTTSRNGVSQVDAFDDVKVDQMVGNNVSGAVLQRTIVCLNGRRETRRVSTVTNVNMELVTNSALVVITNQTVMMSTNLSYANATNLVPLVPAPPAPAVAPASENGGTAPPAAPETGVSFAAASMPAALSTNFSLAVTRTQSGTVSPTQAAANSQLVRTLNNQITLTSNNLSLTLLTNLVMTYETNQVLNYVTNLMVSSVTNVVVFPTNQLVHDYFLYTEVAGPADFSLASGESLVLLVDGTRFGFSPGSSGTLFSSRNGFTSTLYRVPPEVLVAIANAKEVRVRIKGTSGAIEREMNTSSKQHFRNFLVDCFAAKSKTQPVPPRKKPSGKSAPGPASSTAHFDLTQPFDFTASAR
jgi:hypothetical protein